MDGIRASDEPEASTIALAAAARAGTDGAGELFAQRYRLGRRLGSGGFGTVFEAEDVRLGRTVALKLIDGAAATPERARREAMAAARLHHPGVVAVYDAGEAGGARYLVSELVRGRTLAELEGEGALSDRDVVRIGLALADALIHAHERGVVHRDVKPQNVIVPDVAEEDPGPRSWRGAAKLADFGIASLAGDEPLTRTGDIVGTIAYMAPEQAAGDELDDRADLYSLGLVLYEALSGVQPVRAASPAATARRIGTVLAPLSRHRPDLPPGVCEAIDATLHPDPDGRGELEDLCAALSGSLTVVSDDGGTLQAHPVEDAARELPRALRRIGAGAGAGALFAMATAAFVPDAHPGPVVAGAGVAVVTALLPRAGWLAGAGLLVAALLTSPPPGPAVALLAALAAVPVVALLRRRGAAWSVPALAPVLGLAALAPVYPALAGRAGSLAFRASLGAVGALWLLLAEPLFARRLWAGSRPPEAIDGVGVTAVAETVLIPLATSGSLALAGVWAIAAGVLPWFVRGRVRAHDAVAAMLWAAGLAGATALVAGLAGSTATVPAPELAVAAGAAAVVAAWRRS